MLCKNCGSELLPGAKFCNECGAKIENDELATQVEEVSDVSEEIATENIAADSIPTESTDITAGADEQIEEADVITDECEPQSDDDTNYKPLEDVVKSEYIGYDPQKQAANSFIYQNRKQAPYKRSGGAHAAASILSVILFVFLIVTVALSALQLTLSENTVSEALKRANINELKVEDIFDEQTLNDLGIESTADGTKLIDYIYDNIDQSKLSKPLSREDFYTIADSDEFRDFVAMMISRKASDIIDGVRSNLFDIDEIIDFLVQKRGYIETVLGYSITDEMIKNLRDEFSAKYADVISDIKTDEVTGELGPAASAVIKIVFSKWLMIVMICASCLIMALIFLSIHSWSLGLLYNGIVLAIVSAIYLASAYVFNFVDLVVESDNLNPVLVQTFFRAASAVSDVLLIINGIIFAVAVIMIIGAAVIRSAQHKKYSTA